jgi:MoaA/NifB/PqqE/SkfB family radical SAM enzyme
LFLITSTDHYRSENWKVRSGPAGLHFFNRSTGLNVLIDEIVVPSAFYSRAPRQISIALTNRCDLPCLHCYAPKSKGELCFDTVVRWLAELDEHGTLGVGFGGGEPTLHPEFVKLCQYIARETRLSISFTTHGHHIDAELADNLRGNVNFIRVSMDGVGKTYEAIRRRSFAELLERLRSVRSISPFGVNTVVNNHTFPELDEVARVAAVAGACELLLLPQMPIRNVPAASLDTLQGLRRWVEKYKGSLKLCINESSAEGFPTCDPMMQERGVRAYAHIDASGVIKPSSYSDTGVQLKDGGVLQAIDQLVHDFAEDNL